MKSETDTLSTAAPKNSTPRRDFLKAGFGAVLAAGVLNGVYERNAEADNPYNAEVIDALNFLYQIKLITDGFYDRAKNTVGLIPDNDRSAFNTIRNHENGHMNLLKGLLGNRAIASAPANYTGRFDAFSNYATFLFLAQGIEDACTGAVLGVLPSFNGYPDTITSILQLRSADARHAAKVRLIRGKTPWITPGDLNDVAVLAPLYAGENSLVQGGIGLPDSVQALEAFDEPLSRDAVNGFFQSIFG